MVNAIYQALVNQLSTDEQNRVTGMRKAWEAYYGKLPKALKVKPGGFDDNVNANICRVIVDKGVSFLFGQAVEFELDENETTKAEEWLEEVWRFNRKMTFLQKLALNGCVCGHAFVKIVYRPGMEQPRLIALDPESVSVRTKEDDLDEVLEYIIQYPSVDPVTRKPIAVRQRIVKNERKQWEIIDERADLEKLDWKEIRREVWLYQGAPIVHAQNLPAPGEFWGMSDLEPDVITLNSNINFVLSNAARIIRYHAHPKTVGTGFDTKQLQIGVDETIVLPNPQAKMENLEMRSDLGSSIRLYVELRQALHELARIPEVATGRVESLGALSGLALQILYQPLLEKTETKRLLYGDLLGEVNATLLEIGDFERKAPENVWPEMLPSDPKLERDTALIDKQLGVSTDTILERLGYNPELEKQKKEEEGPSMAEAMLSAFDRGDITTESQRSHRKEEKKKEEKKEKG